MKKFKDVVKQNPEPARGKSGTDPMDPWNAKSGIAEASEAELLKRYLKSRGINPEFIPTDTKIAHAKSSAFLSWRRNHEFDESVDILEAVDKEDTLTFDIPLMIRMLELAREDVKDDMELHRITERLIQIRDKGVLTMDDYEFIAGIKKLKEEIEEIAEGRMKDIATNDAEDKRLNKMSTLQKFRADSAARAKKHDNIEKNSGGMTSAIDRLEKHMNEEELDEQINEVLSKDATAGDWIHDFIHSDNPKFAGKSKAERKKMALGAYYGKQNEEVEQIDEISKTTLSSYKDKATTSLKTAQTNRDAAEPGKDMSKGFADLHAKSNTTAKKRVKGLMGYLQRKQGMKPTSENTLDAKAATEAPVSPGEGVTEAQKQRSKSARMIKALYKKKGMKEETYDWEKDDKNMQVIGKKPKLKDTSDVDNVGEDKPDARAILSGGKTMTGEKRDDVEIDPFMTKPKNNTPDDFEKPIGRKDK